MIALLFALLVVILILAALGHISASAKRQERILRELQRREAQAAREG